MDKNKVIQAATRFVQKGQLDRAIAEYGKILREDPKDVRVLLKVGELQQKSGDAVSATKTLLRVAETYSADGFFLKAVAVYKQVLKLDASLIDVNVKLADLYQQLGLMQDALAQYQQVAARHEQAGNLKAAIEALRRMVGLDPENLAGRVNLAELYAKEGRTAEAVREFRRAAEALKAQGRPADFLRVGERIVFLDPDDLALARELATLYLARGDSIRALARLQPCFSVDPKHAETLELLGRAFLDLGQQGKAASVFKELARVHADAGRADQAREVWKKVLRAAPDDSDARAALEPRASPVAAPAPGSAPDESPRAAVERLIAETDVYVKYGLRDKALDHLRQVLEIDPDCVEAHERAATLFASGENPEKSWAALGQACRIYADRGWIARGRVHYERLREEAPHLPELAALAKIYERRASDGTEEALESEESAESSGAAVLDPGWSPPPVTSRPWNVAGFTPDDDDAAIAAAMDWAAAEQIAEDAEVLLPGEDGIPEPGAGDDAGEWFFGGNEDRGPRPGDDRDGRGALFGLPLEEPGDEGEEIPLFSDDPEVSGDAAAPPLDDAVPVPVPVGVGEREDLLTASGLEGSDAVDEPMQVPSPESPEPAAMPAAWPGEFAGQLVPASDEAPFLGDSTSEGLTEVPEDENTGVEEEAIPGVVEGAIPDVSDDMIIDVGEDMFLDVGEYTIPAAGEEAIPEVGGGAIAEVGEEPLPDVGEDMIVGVGADVIPAAGDEAIPEVGGGAIAEAGEEPLPDVGEDMIVGAGGGAIPAVGEDAFPEVGEGTIPDVEDDVIPNVGESALSDFEEDAVPDVGPSASSDIEADAYPDIGEGALAIFGEDAIPDVGDDMLLDFGGNAIIGDEAGTEPEEPAPTRIWNLDAAPETLVGEAVETADTTDFALDTTAVGTYAAWDLPPPEDNDAISLDWDADDPLPDEIEAPASAEPVSLLDILEPVAPEPTIVLAVPDVLDTPDGPPAAPAPSREGLQLEPEELADIETELDEASFFLAQNLLAEARDICRSILARAPGHPTAEEILRVVAARSEAAPLRPADPLGPPAEPAGPQSPIATADFLDLDHPGSDETPRLDEFPHAVADVFAAFKKGLSQTLRPEDSQARYDLGIAYHEMGLFADAIEQFSAALDGFRGELREVDCLSMIARCRSALGEHDEAIARLVEALELPGAAGPARRALLFELGASHEARGDLAEALARYAEVEQEDPAFRDVGRAAARLRGLD